MLMMQDMECLHLDLTIKLISRWWHQKGTPKLSQEHYLILCTLHYWAKKRPIYVLHNGKLQPLWSLNYDIGPIMFSCKARNSSNSYV